MLGLLVQAALDVGMDKAALDGTGAKQSGLDDEIVEGGGLGLGEQVPLPGTLDLENRQGLAATDEGHRARVGGRGWQVVDVGSLPNGLLDEVERRLDGAKRAQAEQVKLDEAETLHVVFIDLQRAHAVGGDAYRQKLRQRLTGQDHAAIMEAEVAWQS